MLLTIVTMYCDLSLTMINTPRAGWVGSCWKDDLEEDETGVVTEYDQSCRMTSLPRSELVLPAMRFDAVVR